MKRMTFFDEAQKQPKLLTIGMTGHGGRTTFVSSLAYMPSCLRQFSYNNKLGHTFVPVRYKFVPFTEGDYIPWISNIDWDFDRIACGWDIDAYNAAVASGAYKYLDLTEIEDNFEEQLTGMLNRFTEKLKSDTDPYEVSQAHKELYTNTVPQCSDIVPFVNDITITVPANKVFSRVLVENNLIVIFEERQEFSTEYLDAIIQFTDNRVYNVPTFNISIDYDFTTEVSEDPKKVVEKAKMDDGFRLPYCLFFDLGKHPTYSMPSVAPSIDNCSTGSNVRCVDQYCAYLECVTSIAANIVGGIL